MFCRASVELMSLRIDGLLDAQDTARLDSHLQTCPACRAQWMALREADTLLRGAARRPATPPADFQSRVMARVALTPATRPALWERERQQVQGGRPTVKLGGPSPIYGAPVGLPGGAGAPGLLGHFHPLQGQRMGLYLGGLSLAGVLSMMLLVLAGLVWAGGAAPLPSGVSAALNANPDTQAVSAWLGAAWALLSGFITGIDWWMAAAATALITGLSFAWWRIVGSFARRANGTGNLA